MTEQQEAVVDRLERFKGWTLMVVSKEGLALLCHYKARTWCRIDGNGKQVEKWQD